MSTSIDSSFVAQYEREVHHVFQRFGSKTLNTVRRKTNVVGSSTTFQKIGKGVATTKARHGVITPMNQTHTPVPVTLQDFYAGDYVDKLDEAKINFNEREVIVKGGAGALARKADNQIVTAMDGTTNTEAHASVGVTRGKVQSVLETLGDNDVFEDGEMYATVGWNAWNDLQTIAEFASADYVGNSFPWLSGSEAKRWWGIMWIPSAVTNDVKSGSTFLSFIYHKTAVGYASGGSITADITWQGPRAAHFVNHAMSGNAVLIDDGGVVEMQHQ